MEMRRNQRQIPVSKEQMATLGADLKLAFRLLRQSPGFAVIALRYKKTAPVVAARNRCCVEKRGQTAPSTPPGSPAIIVLRTGTE